jgi:FtsH ternary system-associated peptide
MTKTNEGSEVRVRFVSHLPDLITDADYQEPERKRIRVRLAITPEGIEILGDSMYAPLIEELLAKTGAKEIERMLCG